MKHELTQGPLRAFDECLNSTEESVNKIAYKTAHVSVSSEVAKNLNIQLSLILATKRVRQSDIISAITKTICGN
jgi:ABC-type tungstate transport system substrate-binding protein